MKKQTINEVKRFQKLAGLINENWHPDDPASVDMDDMEDKDPEDFDDVSEDADYESESGDTNAMGDTDAMSIDEDQPKRKGTLDQKESIVKKLQDTIGDYLEDLGLRKIPDEETPKFERGFGFTRTTPSDAFNDKVTVGFHFMTPDDDPKRSDPRHNDQEVHYNLRIYKPNERFNTGTLRGFIQQAKREAQKEGFWFYDRVNRSNQDTTFRLTVR
jgi:hypothetical protein